MSRTAPWSASRGPQQIRLSSCGFAFWWLTIFTVHLVTCAYNNVYAKLYWGFEFTTLSFLLAFNEIGMPLQDSHSIAYVYMVLATIHGMCALLMIAGSLQRRKLVFMPRRRKTNTEFTKTNRENFTVVNNTSNSATIHPTRVVRCLSAVYHSLGSHHGILGVKGKHFHVVLICRELVELSLQTAQAIRMSKYLPRVLLNRFYVSLLVVNCWSSVFAYSRWFWRDEARRRFAAIVCDCVLNLMTTIGVSLIIMLSYINEYDIYDFDWRLLDDDAWVSQMLNEARVVLVMSWSDLVTRAFFSLSLVATTADMKELLQSTPRRGNRGTNTVGPNVRNLVGPNRELIETTTPRSKNNFQLATRQSSYKSTGFRTRLSRILLQGAHYAFGAWGVIVLVLHVHASMQTPLFECTPKVFPMAGALPSCYTVTFDCYCVGISGLKREVTSEWDGFDRSTTTNLETLPDDLDAKWLAGSVVQLENSKLVAVPSGLVRSQPYYLVLTGNPITRLPPELFEGDIQYIYLGRTKVNELPETVTPISLSTLDITNTNISYFPSWIDPLVEVVLDMYPLVFAGGSIYCSELEKIMSGVTTDFNRSAHSSLLMNASEANWEVLNQAVDCSPPLLKTQFSLDYFDATYGLGQ
ncbi:hypothetical protein JG687_00004154 [Phytophthora cactorum]|uniref:Uncharacterized protein n=1 Tax=Phytophthora cactorum TaxID=29920 RepID=A0A8T1USC7_9STRA|nr:hypothetical protein JG687_00004154 [Phytophthora cactorum]